MAKVTEGAEESERSEKVAWRPRHHHRGTSSASGQ